METESPKSTAEVQHSDESVAEVPHSTERRSESVVEARFSLSESQSKGHGGWKAVKFIIGNEAFEKLSSMSLVANLTVYLNTKYNLSGVFLVNVVNMWMGASNLTAVFGAVVSDAYWGRFLTLVYGSCCALLGMSALTSTAAVTKLRLPSNCNDQKNCQPHKWQLAFLFFSLTLVAVGSGGIKPCNIAFGSDQFDTKTEKGKAQLETFFNWWFFSFTVALVFALTAVVYIQTNLNWIAGFAIPTACLAISITIFLIGRSTYVRVPPKGTVFSDMFRVFVAAIRKRKVSLKPENGLTFYDPKDDSNSRIMKIDRFKCLEKAAVIVNPNELDALGKPVNNWKLCSMQQVENMKAFVRVLPVCIAGLGCFLALDQQATYGSLQALQMDRRIGRFKIPAGWMGAVSMIALSIWIFIYEQIYVPIVRKITKKPSRLTMEQRILIGIIMSILCMVVAGVVEMKRRSSALSSFVSQLHLAFLLPQYILSGLSEAFSAIALMEFVILYLPESMRSVAGAIYFVSISIASYLSSMIINIINSLTGRGRKMSWLEGPDLNLNRLDYYYYVIAVVCVFDLIYFILIARKFIVVPMVVPIERDIEVGREAEMENSEGR